MENTAENRRKFYVLYLEQKVIYTVAIDFLNNCDNEFKLEPVRLSSIASLVNNEMPLTLKNLTQITDEDSYTIGTLVNCWSERERKIDFFKDDEMKEVHIAHGRMFAEAIGKDFGAGLSHPFANNSTDILNAYDYLRSRGYALPWMGLSVEKQLEYNWINFVG